MNYGNNGYRLNLICLSIDSCNSSNVRRSMCTKSMPLFHLLCNGTNMLHAPMNNLQLVLVLGQSR